MERLRMIITEDIAISELVPMLNSNPNIEASLVPIPIGIKVSEPTNTPTPAETIISSTVICAPSL